jgi:flavodoxin
VNYIVTYYSRTGNTKKVAEAIFNVLGEIKEIKPVDQVKSLEGVDLTFIGFPVMQFGVPAEVRKFVAEHASGKKIALFVTHAMPSESDDPVQKAMLEKELQKCRSVCTESELAGLFHCQGELAKVTADELLATNIPMLMEFAAMRPLTIGHPDQAELEQAADFAIALTGC